MFPGLRDGSSRRVVGVNTSDRGFLDVGRLIGMTQKCGAYQSRVPGPGIVLPFGISGSMNADEPAPGLDIALEGDLLFAIQNIACGVEKDHGTVGRESFAREQFRVFGRIDSDASSLCLGFEDLEARFNIFVPVFGGPGKDKNAGCIGRELGDGTCLLYTSPSPRDKRQSRMPSSA